MRRLCLMILSLCMLVLSGCATINSDITIKNDGSGTWDATVNSQAGPLEKKIITDALTQNNVQNYTLKAPNAEGKMQTVEESDTTSRPVWNVEVKFANGTELEQMRNAITSQFTGKSKEPALQKTADDAYIVDLGTAAGQTNITVDGDIIKESVQDGAIKGNTVTFPENSKIHFTFKPSHSWLLYAGITIVIIIIGGAGYWFYLRRKYYGDAA